MTECIWQFRPGLRQARFGAAGRRRPFGGAPRWMKALPTALQQAPSDWHQEGITAGVQARQDRFGNPLAGLRMWLNATNC